MGDGVTYQWAQPARRENIGRVSPICTGKTGRGMGVTYRPLTSSWGPLARRLWCRSTCCGKNLERPQRLVQDMTVPQGTLCSIGALDVRSCRGVRVAQSRAVRCRTAESTEMPSFPTGLDGSVACSERGMSCLLAGLSVGRFELGVGGAVVVDNGSWDRWRGVRQDVVGRRRGDSVSRRASRRGEEKRRAELPTMLGMGKRTLFS
jgi:hypothetical protein